MIRVILFIGILISNIFLSFGQMNSKPLTYSSGVEVGGLAFSDNNIGAYAGLVMYKKNAMWTVAPAFITDGEMIRTGAMLSFRGRLNREKSPTSIVPITELGMLYYERLNTQSQFQKIFRLQYGYGVEIPMSNKSRIISFIGAGFDIQNILTSDQVFLGIIRLSYVYGKINTK